MPPLICPFIDELPLDADATLRFSLIHLFITILSPHAVTYATYATLMLRHTLSPPLPLRH